MAEFARCPRCYLLHLDTPDDRREHKADHTHQDKVIEALRAAHTKYQEEVARLRAEIASYEEHLNQHPISFKPETITVNDYDEDDVDDITTDTEDATDAYASEPDEDHTSPVRDAAEAFASAVDAYPLAIDRPGEDDDLDIRLANATGTNPTI